MKNRRYYFPPQSAGSTGRRLRIVAAVIALAFVLPFCGNDAEQEDCVSNTEFFQQNVWIPIFQNSCVGCHTPGGQYTGSDFVLQNTGEIAAMEENQRITEIIAQTQYNGLSILLAKPTLQMSHEGGKWMEVGDKDYRALEEFIKRIDEPVSCVSDGGDNVYGVEMMSPHQTLRAAALRMGARLPSQDEDLKVRVNGSDALNIALDELMNEDHFYDWLAEVWNDQFTTNHYFSQEGGNSGLNNLEYFQNSTWYQSLDFTTGQYVRDAVALEPLELIKYIVRNNRPFTEVVTAQYTVANPFSARLYGGLPTFQYNGVDDPATIDQSEFRPMQIPGIPHAGVMTSSVMLFEHDSTDTNVNRHRARVIFKWFLATDILKIADRPIDPTAVNLDHNPTLFNNDCTMCHFVMDPMAGAFKNWNNEGGYEPVDNWNPDMQPPGYSLDVKLPAAESYTALQWLGRQIVKDPRFALAIVQIMHEAVTAQPPFLIPTDADDPSYNEKLESFTLQNKEYNRLTKLFINKDYNLKELVKGIITGPYFRALNADGNGDTEFGIGPRYLLKPKELSPKITAVLGIPYSNGSSEYLTYSDGMTYRFLYGGIDSRRVLKRNREPNGIMGGMQLRMSNTMACEAVPLDFAQDVEDRLLFPFVEMTQEPETDTGFPNTGDVTAIKRNLQYLHYRILGDDVGLESEELNRTYKLFVDVWRIGNRQAQELEEAGESTWPVVGLRCGVPSTHPVTGEEIPDERRFWSDDNYVVQSWMAVVSYLLSDFKFYYQ